MVKAVRAATLRHDTESMPGAYRIEVRIPGAPGTPPIPWIVSNPIYVRDLRADVLPPAVSTPVKASSPVYADGVAANWTVEHSSPSEGAVDVVPAVTGTQLLLRYALSGGPSSHPYAALVVPAGPEIAAHDRITFRANADRPMRVSVQLRAPTADPSGERWHRSVFVDTKARDISVRFEDMRPRGAASSAKPNLANVRWLLFVVDTVNTRAGTAGQLFLDDVRYER